MNNGPRNTTRITQIKGMTYFRRFFGLRSSVIQKQVHTRNDTSIVARVKGQSPPTVG